MLKLIVVIFLVSSLAFGQNPTGMERLLYEFPHGRPAYSPLVNEFEIAPRFDLWHNNKMTGAFYGIDMEYAVSRRFILEAGFSLRNTEQDIPVFIQEPGVEVGAYFTIIDRKDFVVTLGMENHFQVENDTRDQNQYSVEPMILSAYAYKNFQVHLGINCEITSSVKAGFFIAGIYHTGFIRPFLEILKPNEIRNTFVVTPGIVIPVYQELKAGIGIPFTRNSSVAKFGFTLFVAIELGDEE